MSFVDEMIPGHRTFWIEVDGTIKKLLQEEDTDHNAQITIDDSGPKVHIKFPVLYCQNPNCLYSSHSPLEL